MANIIILLFIVVLLISIGIAVTKIRHTKKELSAHYAFKEFKAAEFALHQYNPNWWTENNLLVQIKGRETQIYESETESFIRTSTLRKDPIFQELLINYTDAYLAYLKYRPLFFSQQVLFRINKVLTHDKLRNKVVEKIISGSQKIESIYYPKSAIKT